MGGGNADIRRDFHAESDVERGHLVRPRDDPGGRLPGDRGEDAALQPAPRRGHGAHPVQAHVREGRRDRRLRAHREGLRVREGPLRRADRRRFRRRAGRVEPRDRHPAVRRPRRDRPDDVQEELLPHARRDRREGVRAPARGDEPGQQGRHREGQLPRQGTPRGAAFQGRRLRARDDVLARRDPRGGVRRRRREREGAWPRGRDGPPADREPHRRVEPRRVHRRVPRGDAEDRRGEDQRRGDRGRRGRADRQGRRPDGGPEGERRGGEEAGRRRARAARKRPAAKKTTAKKTTAKKTTAKKSTAKKTTARKKAVGE